MQTRNSLLIGAFYVCAAIWAIEHVLEMMGMCPRGSASCHISVGMGMHESSSAVYIGSLLFVGISLTLRDLIQIRFGTAAVVRVMGISFVLYLAAALIGADGWTIYFAGALAWLIAMAVDMAIFTWLRERILLAVAVSGVVSGSIDGFIFSLGAFGDLAHGAAQAQGKSLVALLTVPFVWLWLQRERQVRVQ